MSTDVKDNASLAKRLWKEIAKVRFGILGLTEGPIQPFQPMTAFPERHDSGIWFFTKASTDLAKAASPKGAEAMLIIQAKDQEFQACVNGRLSVLRDQARIDEYWNPVVAAWYPDGKADPDLTLLKLDVRDASIWLSESGPVTFAFEIAKANITHTPPKVGARAKVKLDAGV